MDRTEPPEGYTWVSCNVREYGVAGHTIHLISLETLKAEHWQTTACGSTANLRGIWRRPAKTSPKPECRDCLKAFEPETKGRRRRR